MKIQDRMDEFEKVADKKIVPHTEQRMADFDKVEKETNKETNKETIKHKDNLPYGIKRYKTCPKCGEIMEIYSIEDKKAIYNCHYCGHKMS